MLTTLLALLLASPTAPAAEIAPAPREASPPALQMTARAGRVVVRWEREGCRYTAEGTEAVMADGLLSVTGAGQEPARLLVRHPLSVFGGEPQDCETLMTGHRIGIQMASGRLSCTGPVTAVSTPAGGR